jgi:predicted SAM-dependent methyltransferase
MATSQKRLTARLRNAAFRVVKRVPPRLASPFVQDDAFRVQASLYTFLGAFAAHRRALYLGDQPFGALLMCRTAEARLTAVLRSRSARWSARSSLRESEVRIAQSIGDSTYEVVIDTAPRHDSVHRLERLLEPNGKLLITAPRGEAESPLRTELSRRYKHVRRFRQKASVPLDFSSPFYSAVRPEAISFMETELGDDGDAEALAVVYFATDDERWGDLRLHVGCGPVALPQWINIDLKPSPAVDFRADVLHGIPFRSVRHIYAEHFIEHLSYGDAVRFVAACRAALLDEGVLRLSTPSLQWVIQTSYVDSPGEGEDDRLRDCFSINRAFRAWGHQFLYNLPALTALLQNAGFATVRSYTYGESDTPGLAGLEQHERDADYFKEPHIIVVEASGRADPQTIRGHAYIEQYTRDLGAR